ncbi:MAG TPA: CBS domain-containing protein [Bryobacteraceae bacterium]
MENGNNNPTSGVKEETVNDIPGTDPNIGLIGPPPDERLSGIASEIKKSGKPFVLTVRTLLGWFGYRRRGAFGLFIIDQSLGEAGLATEPDYRSAWLDSEVALVLAAASPKATISATNDPTYRLRRLRAANNPPVAVSPQQTVKEALTIMMANDFSRLPVMSGERSLNGVVSLSSLAKRYALGAKCETVQDCVEPAHTVRSDMFLFDAINDIINHEYVLVQGNDGKFTGIVTTSDLSLEFRQLAEPFLLLAEIEQHIRVLVGRGNFTGEELSDCRDDKDTSRTVSKVSDLTFGEYVRLLENPARWQRLNYNWIGVSSLIRCRKFGTSVMMLCTSILIRSKRPI